MPIFLFSVDYHDDGREYRVNPTTIHLPVAHRDVLVTDMSQSVDGRRANPARPNRTRRFSMMTTEFADLDMQQADLLPTRDALLGLSLLAALGLSLSL